MLMELNLLPWRDELKRRQIQTALILFAALFFVVIILSHYQPWLTNHKPTLESSHDLVVKKPRKMQTIKRRGYFCADNVCWDFLQFPNNEIVTMMRK